MLVNPGVVDVKLNQRHSLVYLVNFTGLLTHFKCISVCLSLFNFSFHFPKSQNLNYRVHIIFSLDNIQKGCTSQTFSML